MLEGPTDDQLRAAVKAWVDHGGSKTKAAAVLGIGRTTLHDWLRLAESRLGITLRRMADGRIKEVDHEVRPLPEEGGVSYYVLTSVQNNTHIHPEWEALKVYADSLGAEFLVGTLTYQKAAFGPKSVKRGTLKGADLDSLWYAPEAEPFINDKKVEVAPGLIWCGYSNILPTAKRPLGGFETHNGRKSNIVPHVKQEMESVASMPGEATKFNFTTGTITQRNYIQKKEGIMAEEFHAYGGALVSVDSSGDWWVRHLTIAEDGSVSDVGPRGSAPVRVTKEGIGPATVEGVVWGDAHEAEMEPWVRSLAWGRGGMLDSLRPRVQVTHDIFSMRSRGHHDMKDPHVQFGKYARHEDSVETEVAECAEWLGEAHRDWCETIVVPSNHDRHLDRWLKEEDPRKGDLPNWRYHTELQLATLRALEAGANHFNVLEHALRAKGVPSGVRFLVQDESFVLCRDASNGGYECGLHGDKGVAGAKGSTAGLMKLGRPVIKAHDHTAARRGKVTSVGACSLKFPYMSGPGAHSITHAVVYGSGTLQLITMWNGKWRA